MIIQGHLSCVCVSVQCCLQCLMWVSVGQQFSKNHPPWILSFSTEQQSLFSNKLYACCIITIKKCQIYYCCAWTLALLKVHYWTWGSRVETGKEGNIPEPLADSEPVNGECNSVYTILQSLNFSVSLPHVLKIKIKIAPDWLTIAHVAQWSFPVNFSPNVRTNTHPIFPTQKYIEIIFLFLLSFLSFYTDIYITKVLKTFSAPL